MEYGGTSSSSEACCQTGGKGRESVHVLPQKRWTGHGVYLDGYMRTNTRTRTTLKQCAHLVSSILREKALKGASARINSPRGKRICRVGKFNGEKKVRIYVQRRGAVPARLMENFAPEMQRGDAAELDNSPKLLDMLLPGLLP
eukprot:1161075-Pelagomonas_calceolata.AAC.1